MFAKEYFLILTLVHATVGGFHINLYYTDGIKETSHRFQHHCLRIARKSGSPIRLYELMSYCMEDLPSKFHIESSDAFQKFTFDDLARKNITSQQLYVWSAPIDVIERYQSYLNQLATINDSSLGSQSYSNCTLPRFGPMCEYELYNHDSEHSSLQEILEDYYRIQASHITGFTCYTHLTCNRGLYPVCLDWTEICDGQVDCIDDAVDEEHCWQLEINACKDTEYRCANGQCITQQFYGDAAGTAHCVDSSDIQRQTGILPRIYCASILGPSFECEDVSCEGNYAGSSCARQRMRLLDEAMYVSRDKTISPNCWSAFLCLLEFDDVSCDKACEYDKCVGIIQHTCPDMLFFPDAPVLFSNVYLAYRRIDLQYWDNSSISPLWICYERSHYDEFFNKFPRMFFNNRTCIHSKQLFTSDTLSSMRRQVLPSEILTDLHQWLVGYQLTVNYTSEICHKSNMYLSPSFDGHYY